MKKFIKYPESMFLILFLGVLGGSLTIFIKYIFSMNTGSIADWVGSWGTVISLYLIYVQIKEAKDEYSKQHTSKIKVEGVLSTGWIKSEAGGWFFSGYYDLQIWAVNISEATGSYRYVGLCKESEYEEVKNSGFYNQKLILNDYTFLFHDPIVEFKDYNDFEKLEEKTISKIQTIKGERMIDFFFDKSDKGVQVVPICIIYVDVFNNPIVRNIKLRFNDNKLNIIE